MEEWRELSDGDGNGEGKSGLGFDADFEIEKFRFDSCKERLRSVFDQLLVAFMRDKSAGKCIRPIPALCGDGRPVDLFKLFWIVRKIGGHDDVSRKGLWDFVSEECGLGFGVSPFVKLVYLKYLDELEKWLQELFKNSVSDDGLSGVVQKLDLLYWELENGIQRLSQDEQRQQEWEKGNEHANDGANIIPDISIQKNGKLCNGSDHSGSAGRIHEIKTCVNEANGFSKEQTDEGFGKFSDDDSDSIIASTKEIIDRVINRVLDGGKFATDERHPFQDNNHASILAEKVDKKFNSEANVLSEEVIDDEERLSAQQIINSATPSGSDIENVLESRKRKQRSLSFVEMLRWLTHIAKHSDDPSIGLIPECSKWRNYGEEELWKQALLVRGTLQIRMQPSANARQSLLKDQQKKPRMHPLMYEDNVCDPQPKQQSRYSTRIPSLTRSSLCPCCNSHTTPRSKSAICQEEKTGNDFKAPAKLTVTDVEEPHTCLDNHKSSDVPADKQVSVGPLFQAEVPEWTGVHSESDPKWLGTVIWQPEEHESHSGVGLGSMAKERPHLCCTCPFPYSVECVRFHIAEKRFELKQELGLLFYRWGFNRMGEEVSLSWTEEEEKAFKDVVKLNGPFHNNFWNKAYRFLPSKTRQELVSYYFNVFLIQRRSYQNRVTPKDIDSDDDEKECGAVGCHFGYKALYAPSSRPISCTLNKECAELV